MKKCLIWTAVFLAAALAAFAAGYLIAVRSGEERIASVPPAPPPTPPKAGEAVPAGPDQGYRIRLMEEITEDKGGKGEPQAPAETREERPGVTIVRRPLGGIALAVVLDGSAAVSAGAGREAFEEMNAGLEEFLRSVPAGVDVGVRTMGGGEKGVCDESLLILPMEAGSGRSAESFTPAGPRGMSRAMYLAAGDMATRRGRKGIAVVAAGGEECGEWPCETAQSLSQTGDAIRTYAVGVPTGPQEVEPATKPGRAEPLRMPVPVAPGEGETAPAPPPEEEGEEAMPPWLECLGRAGGFARVARGREEVAAALKDAAADLARGVVVRLFRSPGNELTDEADPILAPWKVEAVSLDGTLTLPVASTFLPARLGLPPGRYRITGFYGEVPLSVENLTVGAGEEIEISMLFKAGQLILLDGAGSWPAGPDGCRPVIRVTPDESPLEAAPPEGAAPSAGPAATGAPGAVETAIAAPPPPVYEKCGLPAQFVLAPGRYKLGVEPDGPAARTATVEVGADKASIFRLSPGAEPEAVGPPPPRKEAPAADH